MFPSLQQDSQKLDYKQLLKRLGKKDWLLLACMTIGAVFEIAGVGLFVIRAPSASAEESSALSQVADTEIYVDVGGAVKTPGIYRLIEGARIAEALELAGGITNDADKRYVAEKLNVSEQLHDAQKIFIPEVSAQSLLMNSETDAAIAMSLISINTATQSQLETLPKVGSVTAQKIINARPFAAIEELISKKVVSDGVFAEINSLISI